VTDHGLTLSYGSGAVVCCVLRSGVLVLVFWA